MKPAESQWLPVRALRARDWVLALMLAMAFKAFYADAETTQLQWLLWPLATLLNGLGGFAFRPMGSGAWLDVGHALIIVKACAGGNFLIASWLGYLWRWRVRPVGQGAGRDGGLWPDSWPGWWPASWFGVRFGLQLSVGLALRAFAAAWVTTLIANALRILLIAHGQDDLSRITGWSASDSHRLIGIVVYFGCLSVQLAGARTLLVAPALYLGVVLLVPWLHAILAGRSGVSVDYALWTAAIPVATAAGYGVWRVGRAVTGGRKSRESVVP